LPSAVIWDVRQPRPGAPIRTRRVLFFSPLLDDRAITAALRLRARGHPLTIVDVCTRAPPAAHARAELAQRLWRVQRSTTRNRLAELGITVVPWDDESPLDSLLAPVLRTPERIGR